VRLIASRSSALIQLSAAASVGLDPWGYKLLLADR
jgi:hypothetical protein